MNLRALSGIGLSVLLISQVQSIAQTAKPSSFDDELRASKPVPPKAAEAALTRFNDSVKLIQTEHARVTDEAEIELAKKTDELKLNSKSTRDGYVKKLEELLKTFKEAGDLDAVVSLRKEIESLAVADVQSIPNLPEKAKAERRSYDLVLQKLKSTHEATTEKAYQKALDSANVDFEKKAKICHQTLIADLIDLEKAETRADQIVSALQVRAFTKRAVDLLPPVPATRPRGDASNVKPAYAGRFEPNRSILSNTGGGNAEAELAVARGLAWLARTQRANGGWVFDGTSQADHCAATGMALLPFLAAGQTHQIFKGNTYQPVVSKGVIFLIALQDPAKGTFRTASNMYSHAIATIALCELYGMTGDKKVLLSSKAAIKHIVTAQSANGSWGYTSGTEGDTSISGWAIQALTVAGTSQDIPVPKSTLEKARKFLDSVSGGANKSTYGYREGPGQPGTALTAIGLHCRYTMDGWGPVHLGLKDGVEGLARRNPPVDSKLSMYYYYYATLVVHHHEGDAWHKVWNPKMRDLLVKLQIPQPSGPSLAGSWEKDSAFIGSHCGRLGTTCMALLTLEVYYRYSSLQRQGNEGNAELDRAK